MPDIHSGGGSQSFGLESECLVPVSQASEADARSVKFRSNPIECPAILASSIAPTLSAQLGQYANFTVDPAWRSLARCLDEECGEVGTQIASRGRGVAVVGSLNRRLWAERWHGSFLS